jgi:undecaprenyl diphosphate synthase
MEQTPELKVPRHVAIIMDGNGRWALQRGLPRIEGHRAGAETVHRVVQTCCDLGIEYLTLYAFSTENWQRPVAEIRDLMRLLQTFLGHHLADLKQNQIRLNAIGQIERLPLYVRRSLRQVMAETADHKRGTLTLALSYGSRAEIVAAARALAVKVQAGELQPEAIDEALFEAHLYTVGLPPPDLVIRTSGEMRLSNFLLWQASYAELWVTATLWPDFSKEEFAAAIEEYSRRRRRFGGLHHA